MTPRLLACASAAFVVLALPLPGQDRTTAHNVVLIVADDLGYGDLGCYGQERLRTPNLDRMAEQGLRFTQFYAGSTVCAPSRCVLMTGLHTGHCLIRGNARQNLRPADVTVAEVLRDSGYATACVGKWGIGHEGSDGLPTRQGFDSFFGYLNQRHAHNYYPEFLIRDEERVKLRNVVPEAGASGEGVAVEKVEYSHDLLTDEALAFLQQPRERPFFLFLAYTIPHANNEARGKGMEVPDLGDYGAEDWPGPERGFAAMVTRLDRDIGRLLETLRARRLAENTLVLFTSDNGPHSEGGHDSTFFDSNGPLRGKKRDLTEGGIRVPLIAWWPGRVAAGGVTDHVAGFQDLLPTLAELAAAGDGVPAECDGISFVPTLLGERGQREHDYLYWAFYERGAAQAVRAGRWKAVQQPYRSAVRLYDLEEDPGEEHDLATERPELVRVLRAVMAAAYRPSARWRFPENER